MNKKPRMGSDPLEWIRDSREGGEGGKQDKQSNHSKQGLQDLQSKQVKLAEGRPKTSKRVITKSTQEGLKEGWIRATFIVREARLEKIKDLSYWERKQIKEVVDEALASYLEDKDIKKKLKEITNG